MKLIAAIFFILSIISTDVVVHLIASSNHDLMILDLKTESENESEKEGEHEVEKVVHDSSIDLFGKHWDWNSKDELLASLLLTENYFEIHLPPPDLV